MTYPAIRLKGIELLGQVAKTEFQPSVYLRTVGSIVRWAQFVTTVSGGDAVRNCSLETKEQLKSSAARAENDREQEIQL